MIHWNGEKIIGLVICSKCAIWVAVWRLKIHWLLLWMFMRQVYPKADSDWSYDPKEGFFIQEVSVKHSGWYDCRANVEGPSASMEFYLLVERKNRFSMSNFRFISFWRTPVRMLGGMIGNAERTFTSISIRILWIRQMFFLKRVSGEPRDSSPKTKEK